LFSGFSVVFWKRLDKHVKIIDFKLLLIKCSGRSTIQFPKSIKTNPFFLKQLKISLFEIVYK